MKPEPLFYIERAENNVAGPYDLVQMAGLLRRKIITPETPTRLEGRDAWMPFSWQPQFSIVREMPADAGSTRVAALDEEAMARASGPIPKPSRETVIKLAGLACGVLLAGFGAFLLAWLDQTMGICLAVIGVGAAAAAQCLIWVGMLEEKSWTLLGIFFVPMGNLFYLICNIGKYFPRLCVKYIGIAVALGAVAGLAAH